jgi:hypothetical protein
VKKATVFLMAVFLCAGMSALPEATEADPLPKIIVLGSISKRYEPVRYDHAKHLSLADGCEGCHHQHKSMKIDTCKDCHRFDPATFRKNARPDKLLPCRDCHMATERPGATGQPDLKTAYHNVCNKCHWGEVNSKTLAGCTEMCHTPKGEGKGKKK